MTGFFAATGAGAEGAAGVGAEMKLNPEDEDEVAGAAANGSLTGAGDVDGTTGAAAFGAKASKSAVNEFPSVGCDVVVVAGADAKSKRSITGAGAGAGGLGAGGGA